MERSSTPLLEPPAARHGVAVAALPSRSARWRQILWRTALWILLIDVIIISFIAGLRLRRWAWDQTVPVRYVYDIQNGFNQGRDATAKGWVQTYEDLDAYYHSQPNPQYGLDYTPLRLLVVMQWYQWAQRQPELAQPQTYTPTYALTRPLLALNIAAELASAVAVFLLVRLFLTRRAAQSAIEPIQNRKSKIQNRALPLVASLLVWFNPAIIWEAHCWPQWEVWLLPFFLFAAYCACTNRWLMAGTLVATGALFKGQIVLVAPVFVLWPLFSLRFGAMLRFISGFLLAGGILLSPWVLKTPDARLWVGLVALGAGLLCPWPFLRKSAQPGLWWGLTAAAAVLAFCLFLWPWRSVGVLRIALLVAILAAGTTILLRLISGRQMPHLFAGAIAAALTLCVPVYDGSLSWYRVGFEYGTRHYPAMEKNDSSNLAALLVTRWNWQRDDIALTVPSGSLGSWPAAPIPIAIRDLLVIAYAFTLVLCGIGAAIHSRRNSPRTLIALVAPWVLMFALLPQMHQRYFLWAAGVTAVAVAVDFGLVLLHLLVTLLAWGFMAHTMLRIDRSFSPFWLQLLDGSHPGIAWAVLLCAGIYLYVALSPDPERTWRVTERDE